MISLAAAISFWRFLSASLRNRLCVLVHPRNRHWGEPLFGHTETALANSARQAPLSVHWCRFFASGAAPGAFTALVDEFNVRLASALDAFADETGLDVGLLDVNKLFDAIAADPPAYGFADLDQPVVANPPIAPGTPEAYNPAIVGQDPAVRRATLFLDPEFHPTALGHAIIAETARDHLLG